MRLMPIRFMSTVGIAAVFSFSISYHIDIVTMFRAGGVSVFG
jgi:hypothetical protein